MRGAYTDVCDPIKSEARQREAPLIRQASRPVFARETGYEGLRTEKDKAREENPKEFTKRK